MTDIVIQTEVGQHNASFMQSGARILEGGSWKKQRIAVLIPSANMMAAKVSLSHWNLIMPVNQPVCRFLALGMEVGQAYSQTIEAILAHPDISSWEYILTVEADNMPPADGVLKLLTQMEAHPELSCIGGLYWTKGPGGVPQIWGDVRDPVVNFRPQVPVAGQLIECYGTGMGFNLWRLSMFKDAKLRKPWFKTVQGIGGTGTQDLYFWQDARMHGYRCAIDCSVLVGHHDAAADMTW